MNAALSLCLLMSLAQEKPAEPPKTPAPPPPAQEPVKVEPLLKTLANQITIGGQLRLRAEYRDPIAYNNPAGTPKDDQHEDADLLLERIRLNLTFTLADQITIFFQPQDQRTFGDEGAAATPVFVSDETNLDVHQGWVEVKDLLSPGLSLKIGRMELSYGDQRLVSPLDWSNIGRAWDGAKLRYQQPDWWAEAFYTVIKEVQGAEDDQDFYGFYASYVGVKDHEFDVYVFGRTLNDNLFTGETSGPANDRMDFTPGVRLKGKMAGFDYTAEGMVQRGEVGDDDVKAWAAALTFGYTFDIDWKPRIGVEYTHASGDGDPTDGDHETFDLMYGFGHFYQGFADIFSFKNGKDLALYLKVAPAPYLSFHVDIHTFTLDEDVDSWYNFAGAPIRTDATGAAGDEIGNEIDVHFRWAVGKHVKFWGGVTRFFAGDFVEDTKGAGTDGDMTWAFLQAVVEF
ncbi:MAG TPA: alginate export family protein [Planctomycetota bacterium]